MKQSSADAWLLKAIGQAQRSAQFCVSGSLPGAVPGIHIEGLGPLKLPLKPAAAKGLISHCRVAPYGKGTATLVNKMVRNTLELDPSKFRLTDDWKAAIAGVLPGVAEQLGLPADRLEAKLYKLLVYEKGGFFLPHRDSEKHDRMVASLIVVLPNPFDGGALTVRHASAQRTLTFAEAAAGTAPCYAAFYADCEHEVERVSRGLRLCLAYNLVLKPQRAGSRAAGSAGPNDVLAESIASWMAARPGKPLVFALEHHYTQRSLSLDLLKGADRQLADEVVPAAHDADGLVYLAQVERHLVQDANDGSYDDYRGHGRRRWDEDEEDEDASSDDLEIGETIEDDFVGCEWTDLGGEKQPFGRIPFEPASVVAQEPLDEWTPTREDYEGYTGNAGNTLDRWYHGSALVVWHVDHHFDVITSAGAAQSIPLFASMTAELAKMPMKEEVDARRDCIRLAHAIIDRWPKVYAHLHRDRSMSDCDRFAQHVLRLHDRDTVARLLTKVAGHDRSLPLRSLIPAACREFGWKTFAGELKQLLALKPEGWHDSDVATRDLEWLAAVCCDDSADDDRVKLAGALCSLAVKRFCEMQPVSHRNSAEVAKALATRLEALLQAVSGGGSDAEMARVIEFIVKSQDAFQLDHCQVPCLERLVPWCRRRFGSVPAPMVSWWSSVRAQLESATRSQPEPYRDWKRPAAVECKCKYCAELSSFLADPNQETTRIAAAEHDRTHLSHQIERQRCDVKTKLDRKGRPFSLVLTKTDASFKRAVKRFEADQKLLRRLVDLDKAITSKTRSGE
jgi:hypothetical protein